MYNFEPTKTTALKKYLLTLLSVCMLNICFGQVNLNVGLKAYYPFSGNANDVSGNNNNPVFNNAVLTADRAGNPNSAYHFNGSSSYMKVLNSPTINFVNKMSIALWVKPTGFYTGTCYNNMMVIKGDMDYLPEYYFMRFSDVYTGCTAPTTTQERFYSTGTIAATPIIQLNRWYSVVWTYDGTSSKLYVDCELKQDTYIPGLGFTNAYDLYIGHLNNAAFPYWLNGDLDEIRLYDRVLNQDEVNVLGDCSVVPTTTINDYTAVTGFNPCTNELLVEDASKYNAGDTVVLMQMKGADFDSTNTAAFGTVSDYKNAGNYEFNYIKSKSGNTLELTNILTRQYDPLKGKVQLIRVPYFRDYTVTTPLTAAPWDGKKGGVLILNVQNTITLNENIDVRGKGFAGATGVNTNRAAPPCSENNFFYSSASGDLASRKGEGLVTISDGKIFGKGPLANGGGSGNSYNSGGGGGGNAGAGGFGGFQSESCPGALDNRGIGGKAIPYSNAANKIFLGGGGGSGHTNNAEGFLSNGATGAGIAIIICNQLTANNKSIQAKGDDALTCGLPGNGCHEAMGGGGAGGTVLLKTNMLTGNLTINTNGGAGANMLIPSSGRLGPGGGGGAGITWLSNASLPASITIQNAAGPNGTCTGYSNAAWGATAGTTGNNLFNLVIPMASVPFKKNIDSVRFNSTATFCTAFDFFGLSFTNFSPITFWAWDFGDGNTANTQNASNNYAIGGTYIVKLVATDINGCKDSITKTVNTGDAVANAGIDTAYCSNGTVTHTLHANTGAAGYSWTPAAVLNNPSSPDPVATITATTRFYLTVTGSAGCEAKDSVDINVNPLPIVQTLPDTSFCQGMQLVLTTTPGLVSYDWSPPAYVNNPAIANPVFIGNTPQALTVTGTDANGCKATDIVNVGIKPLPVVKTIEDSLICSSQSITLTTTGASTYSWSPAVNLDNPSSPAPVFSGTTGQTYTVTGTAANGCASTDVVTISVNPPVTFKQPPTKGMCSGQSVVLDGNNGTTVDYQWSPAAYLSNTTSINPVANPPVTTVYQLLVTDRACAQDSIFNVTVNVSQLPIIGLRKSGDIDCVNRTVTLNATGGTNYAWSPPTGLNNPTIPNPVASAPTDQTYTVTVTNGLDCSSSASITVYNKKAASLARYMPSAFTPDGNGLNDCYRLKDWLHITKLEFYIYNRWGEPVFYTTRVGACWDGNYKGKKAEAGNYVYYIKAQTECGLEEQRGNVMLIR